MMYRTLLLAPFMLTVASGAFMTFFGEDLNDSPSNDATPLEVPADIPNSLGARADFLELIEDPDTESFEEFAVGTSFNTANPNPNESLELTFVCPTRTITATITGRGSIQDAIASNGQYPIDGTKYLRSSANAFTVTLSEPVGAFGFFGVDIGDVEGQLTITATVSMEDETEFQVEQAMDVNSGSVLFFGITEDTDGFDKVTFENSESDDGFAFDLFTIACPEQILESVAPSDSPTTMLCREGIPSDDGSVCCCASCGVCGDCECALLGNGPQECCPETIRENGMECMVSSQCGCILMDVESDPFGERGLGCDA